MKSLSQTAARTYEIIVRRFLSIFYPAAVYSRVSLALECKNERFNASFKVLVDEGYLKVAKIHLQKHQNRMIRMATAQMTARLTRLYLRH